MWSSQSIVPQFVHISGDSCRGIVKIYDERNDSAGGNETDEEDLEKEITTLKEELGELNRKHKRLMCQKMNAVGASVVCQIVLNTMDQAEQALCEASPLIEMVSFLRNRIDALNEIDLPQLKKTPKTPSESVLLTAALRSQEGANHIVKFSMQEVVHNHLYDYSDASRTLKLLTDAVKDLQMQVEGTEKLHDEAYNADLLQILVHVHAMRKLASQVTGLSNICVNFRTARAENIIKQCVDILKSRHDNLSSNSYSRRIHGDHSHNVVDLNGLRADRLSEIASAASQISDIEAIEEEMQTFREKLYSPSRLLRSFYLCMNVLRSQKPVTQMQLKKHHTTGGAAVYFAGGYAYEPQLTIPDNFIQQMDPLRVDDIEAQLEPLDNRQAIEYLTSLQYSVDTSKLAARPSLPKNDMKSVINELVNFTVLHNVEECDQFMIDANLGFNKY